MLEFILGYAIGKNSTEKKVVVEKEKKENGSVVALSIKLIVLILMFISLVVPMVQQLNDNVNKLEKIENVKKGS